MSVPRLASWKFVPSKLPLNPGSPPTAEACH
jgi:hypothetical protein